MAIADNSDKVWYYAKEDGQKYGPYTDEELIKLIRNGILSENDLIWMTDLDDWISVGNSIYSFYLTH
ncbi:DUF4339 domain-containing protein [Erysipelotrichaceae bacterium Oil+RF-744-GAM-WT-6]|jgi:hypothetical protein|uniref:DUF4339 domain-containing protein n=1 Tax=Stecheria intestinalis TaxID=2606630 RepID=A0A7X2TFG2_9FIRM|nr:MULTISPECIES: DUF4339 domain-containing protein [Erysipelotrichaceae]MCI2154760.1 DUF4339 domain-containing protein [Solobacterium sp.]MDY3234959.1 DUF4339 domain-containing protein [Erysipelotrichaceae bacterium]MDY4681854.1 DUF4339 domain-containing protein [Lachnospiraceae bacterium]MCI6744822.1 DUF4339 domain-containing protein [Anaerolactibacter massiliensis]MDD5882122.1 DUF4339 domain-containing protein [Stecheria intestinalis]